VSVNRLWLPDEKELTLKLIDLMVFLWYPNHLMELLACRRYLPLLVDLTDKNGSRAMFHWNKQIEGMSGRSSGWPCLFFSGVFR